MPTPDRHSAADQRPRRLPRLLLVHDDAAFALLIREAFRQDRCFVLVEIARSVAGAVARLSRRDPRREPSLILLGIPPHRGGDRFLLQARYAGLAPGVPIVQLVQLRRALDEERALAFGADLYLELPEDWDGYRRIVERARELIALRADAEADDGDPETGGAALPLVAVLDRDAGRVHRLREAFIARQVALAIDQASSRSLLEFQLSRRCAAPPRLIVLGEGEDEQGTSAALHALRGSPRWCGIPVLVLGAAPDTRAARGYLALGADACRARSESPTGMIATVELALALMRREAALAGGARPACFSSR